MLRNSDRKKKERICHSTNLQAYRLIEDMHTTAKLLLSGHRAQLSSFLPVLTTLMTSPVRICHTRNVQSTETDVSMSLVIAHAKSVGAEVEKGRRIGGEL